MPAASRWGRAGRTLILVGSTVSMFGYVSGMTLAVPRMLFAFGRDGFLPRSIAARAPALPYAARRDRRFRPPSSSCSRRRGSFEGLAIVANGSVLLVYAACCLGDGRAAPARRARRWRAVPRAVALPSFPGSRWR